MENSVETSERKQVIKVDINDDCLEFFSYLDDATKEWLRSLDHIWQLWKRCDSVSHMLVDFFDSAPNPYLSTLRILVNTPDFKNIKVNSSLALTVIEEFAKWLEPRKDLYEHNLEVDLKLAAFRLMAQQSNMQFTKLVADTYEFINHRAELLDVIEQMVQQKKYKEAAQYAAMLKLQRYFPNFDILLLPLILQNKLTIVEEFLEDCPELQRTLIEYLDSLLSPASDMQIILDEIIDKQDIPDIKMSLVQTKPMIKLIKRLVKLYNLPQEVYPNVNKKQSEGALQFLIHKRYRDGSLSTASWREMVQEAVGTDKTLQNNMIKLLIGAKDAKEALYWAKQFNIPREQWPWALTYEADRLKDETDEGASTSQEEVNWGNEESSMNYHELKISRDSIKIIDNAKSFEAFIHEGLEGVDIVGIDSEWKPSFGTKQPDLALIQIATKSNVYILDLLTIGNKSIELWEKLATILFDNKYILKLGFGIVHDITVIRNSLPVLSKIKTCGQGYLDIIQLWKKLVDDYKFVFPHEDDQHFTKKSLSKLVELCLGQKLNKSDQFSNWEQRPLREGQIIYAALDAYCLLEIYAVLKKQSQNLDIPFEDICAEIQNESYKFQKKNTKKHPYNKSDTSRNGTWNSNKQENVHNNHSPYGVRYSRSPMGLQSDQHYTTESGNPRMGLMQPDQHSAFKPTNFAPRKPINQWLVVCDSTLGALANKLRMCGCDCSHILFDQDGERTVKVAMNESRVLLTRKADYLKFSEYLPPGRSYCVMADNVYDQLQEVLGHYGVYITRRNIFSRCQNCNGNEFAKVLQHNMVNLTRSFVRLSHQNNSPLPSPLLDYIQDSASSLNNFDSSNVNRYVPKEDRTWILSTKSVNIGTCSTRYHSRIQIDKVPINVLKNVQTFYICERCGKIYWDGSHLERTLNDLLKDFIVPV